MSPSLDLKGKGIDWLSKPTPDFNPQVHGLNHYIPPHPRVAGKTSFLGLEKEALPPRTFCDRPRQEVCIADRPPGTEAWHEAGFFPPERATASRQQGKGAFSDDLASISKAPGSPNGSVKCALCTHSTYQTLTP